MNTQIRVITHITHEQAVSEALAEGGYTIVERTEYNPLHGVGLLVEHQRLPVQVETHHFKDSVLRWLKYELEFRQGYKLFFVVVGA